MESFGNFKEIPEQFSQKRLLWENWPELFFLLTRISTIIASVNSSQYLHSKVDLCAPKVLVYFSVVKNGVVGSKKKIWWESNVWVSPLSPLSINRQTIGAVEVFVGDYPVWPVIVYWRDYPWPTNETLEKHFLDCQPREEDNLQVRQHKLPVVVNGWCVSFVISESLAIAYLCNPYMCVRADGKRHSLPSVQKNGLLGGKIANKKVRAHFDDRVADKSVSKSRRKGFLVAQQCIAVCVCVCEQATIISFVANRHEMNSTISVEDK